MTPFEFARSLADAAPSVAALQSVGLSRAGAMNFREGFLSSKREAPLGISASDEIRKLMNEWDVSHVEIGLVRLLGSPIPLEHGAQVGVVETDPLVVLSGSGELLVEELDTNGHVLWHVAENSGRFLEAILAAAKMLGDRAIGAVDYDDMEAARRDAQECAKLAGGAKYLDFYLMLFAAE